MLTDIQDSKEGVAKGALMGEVLSSGLLTNAPPALVAFKDRILCFYRDGRFSDRGNGLMTAEFKGGKLVDIGNTGHDVAGGVGVVDFGGTLHLFCRHAQGTQMFVLSSETANPGAWRHMWGTIEISHRPSAAVLRTEAMTCFAADASGHGVMRALFLNAQGWAAGGLRLGTTVSPAMVTFQGAMHLYYQQEGGTRILHLTSRDGIDWGGLDTPGSYIGVDSSNGVALAELNGKLYMFYRDANGDGILCSSTNDGSTFQYVGNTGLTSQENPACVVVGDQFLVAAREPDFFDPTRGPRRQYGLHYTLFRP